MTDDMDFTKPQPDLAAASAPFKASGSRFYDSKVAGQVFRACGTEEKLAPEQVIFSEEVAKSRGPSRMYYVVDGEVALSIGGRPLETIGKGEVFGEMAVITGRPRSATARARGACVVCSMDVAQAQAAIGKVPEFGLMLASVMYDRLRFVAAQLAQRTLARGAAAREATVFEPALVTQFERALPRSAVVRYNAETVIFKEGQAGTFMYLVKSGRIAIAVGSNIVEVVGPAGPSARWPSSTSRRAGAGGRDG
jgi:CRP-like cAMP-binding protein